MRTRSTLFLEISRGLLKKLTKVDFSPISRKKAPKWIPLKFLPIPHPPPPYYICTSFWGNHFDYGANMYSLFNKPYSSI